MTRNRLIVTLALFAGLVACDHGTKIAAKSQLEGKPPAMLVRGAIDLSYHENYGIAFNLERVVPEPARLPVYVLFTSAIMIGLGVAWWRRRSELSWTTVGYAFIAAGAVGNLLDRIVRGYVVDFVHIHGWPVFNAADVWIGVGVGCLVVAMLRQRRAPKPPVPPAVTTPTATS
ncbi:MAG: signal peptidase II [Myxococcota bacterium]